MPNGGSEKILQVNLIDNEITEELLGDDLDSGTGLLTGVPLSTATPGGYGEFEAGGYWRPELKWQDMRRW